MAGRETACDEPTEQNVLRADLSALACVASLLVVFIDAAIGQTVTTEAPARDFPAMIITSALNIGAIIFGVFGFLYSVYAMYLSSVTASNPRRPAICDALRDLCRVLVGILIATAVIAIVALGLMWPPELWNRALAVGLGGLTLGITIVSWRIAFTWMK